MADKKFYWLKLKRDFFKRHDIRIIEAMPNGKDYILFYLKLLLESIDHEGELRFSDAIPYNDQMLSVITNTNIDIVRSAMKLFVELKLVEIKSDETIYMEEVSKMIGSETKWAEYKRKGVKAKAENLPQLTVCQRLSCEMVQLPNGKVHYVDEKRYGGNAGLALDRAEGRCEMCGETENLVIHHNNGFSNELDDLLVLCKKCHAKLENFQRNSKTVPTEIEKEKEKEKETEQEEYIEEAAPPPSPKPVRHKYGAYKNVLLSDEDYTKLQAEFPRDWSERIERLSEYIASTGKSYKNHLATIRSWARKDKPKSSGNVFKDMLEEEMYG